MTSHSTQTDTRLAHADAAVVHRLFERVYSKGELLHVDDIVAPAVVLYSDELREAYVGSDGIGTHVKRLRRAFHGFTMEVDALHLSGESFVAEWTARGSHERPFMGVEPTCIVGGPGTEPHGKRIEVSGVAAGTIRNGVLTECRLEWDLATLRRQLGAPDRADHPGDDVDASAARRRPLDERNVAEGAVVLPLETPE